jgi:acyl-CoA synthetase (AMP-forming)/AMP-acid ligase II
MSAARLDQALQAASATAPPGRSALEDEDERISFSEMIDQAGRVAERLTAAGHGRDEAVLVPVSNRARDIVAFLAVWRAGGVVVPVHRTTPAPAVDRLQRRIGARSVVNLRPDIEVAATLKAERQVRQLRTDDRPPPDILKDAAWVIFTSGSTGEPKGVVHDHQTYLSKMRMIDGVLRYSGDERVLVVLQLSFIFAQWVAILTLLKGGTAVFREKFDADEFREALADGVTRVAVVPTMMRALRQLGPQDGADGLQGAASFTGAIMSGGEVLDAPLRQWMRDQWPDAGIWDIYGLTETATTDFIVGPEDGENAAGTIGQPAPGIDYRIAEPDGELQIRSPHAMRGYFGASELTAEAFDGAYFRTGDMARLLESGYVQVIGRRKDIINRGGNKISPLEVERVFLEHPEIAAALATGIEDPLKGEAFHLMVVLATGAKATLDSLRQWGRQRLDRQKLPDAIHIAADLPEGRTGKADRQALRKALSR